MTDKEMIIRALQLWFLPGDVFEIRILDAVSVDWMRPHMESGYFDYEHIPAAADAIAKLRSYRGAYVTINPVKPDLLARACNRIRGITREPTTADSDIAERRWLLIDCDPKRVSGVSSTDAEHKAAIQKAHELRDDMASVTWPEPVICDSGNGAQMMYRISLPPDDEGLIQRTIESLSSASTDAVEIDKTVHNPARIWRIPGTMNCKGDSIPARPHRMAQLLSVPSTLTVLSRGQLERVASFTAQPNTVSSPEAERTVLDGFDIDRWLAQYFPELSPAQPWKGGRKWVFPVCPFNDAHRNRSAVLIQEASGAIAFKCHHNGCVGNDWKKLRVLKEPGCYDRKPIEPVDISGILNQKQRTVISPKGTGKNVAEDFSDPGKLKEKLLHVPGFLDEFTEFSLSCAPKQNRVLSFCGALACLSFLAGRNVTDIRNNRPNIYLIALANSGVGKDHPRRINKAVACGAMPSLNRSIADSFASGEALEDALFLHPSMLFQVDEMDTLINSMKTKDSRAEGLIEKMLRIFSSSSSSYTLRSKAIPRNELTKRKAKQQEGLMDDISEEIHNPYLVIFGTAIPQMFYQALDKRLLTNGLTARCLIIEAGARGNKNHSRLFSVPESLIRSAKVVLGYGANNGNLNAVFPQPIVIPTTGDADALLDRLDDKYDALYQKYDAEKALVPMSFWARAFEKVCKLAQLYAISENITKPVISVDGVKWASQFVEFLTEQTLFLTNSYSFENPFDEKCQKALRYIREAGGSYSHAALLKRMHESKEVFKQIIDTLLENGSIVSEYVDTGGKKMTAVYRLQ